jgi:hypothetical protein
MVAPDSRARAKRFWIVGDRSRLAVHFQLQIVMLAVAGEQIS